MKAKPHCHIFTSESVSEGHPDKVCDNISDGIVDAILASDPYARTAVECAAAFDTLLIMGEVTTTANVDYEAKAREIIKEIGYDFGTFAYDKCKIIVAIHTQSPDIAMGVDTALEARDGDMDEADAIGAGDQGMMFGYATNETESFMPLPVYLAHGLTRQLTALRKSGEVAYLLPDGKSQVTVEYEDDKPVRVDTVVISTQHKGEATLEQVKQDVIEKVIKPVIPAELLDENTKYFINPTGRFVIGGPQGDTGLTGRKIIVDTYGGMARHGGGAFSGKDCTKVDRSGAYAARYVAKNVVAAGLADRCEVQLAYAIGVAYPVSILVDTFGTNKVPEEQIVKAVRDNFDLRPAGIIRELDLRRPIYKQTAAYGHFGRTDLDLPWEQLNKVEALKKSIAEQA